MTGSLRRTANAAPSPLGRRWRDEAAILRRRGAGAQADVLESCAAELEEYEREHALEALSLEAAAGESGYSYSALEKMVRRGELLNIGQRGGPRVRRGDLPRKAAARSTDQPGLAERALAGRATTRLARH